MKKFKYHLLVIGILVIVASILFLNDRKGTLKVDPHAFAVKDTSEITMIQFDKGEKKLTLERAENGWLINHSFNAKSAAVKGLMKILMNLEIQSPVSRSMKKDALRSLSGQPLQVVVKSDRKELKSFRIVENDSLHIGSLALMEGDSDPYVLQMPGFEGRLSQIFPLDPSFWRDKSIFGYGPAEIKSVEVKYPNDLKSSFMYYFQDFSNLLIKSLSGQGSLNIDKETARGFLMNFKSISYERQVPQRRKEIKDSLLRVKAFCEITLTTNSGQIRKIKTYRIPVQNKKMNFDVNQMYAVIQNDTVPVLVKYIDFDPIMKQYSDFATK